ncbi:MAG: MFS transporter [Candidatus Wolfebacteria bacterium]|nr:MFS transporter [Candidatus Wolfebacteria bacterium]
MKINFNISINRVVKFFVLSDLFFLGGWSLISPIFSIFVIEKIAGATLISVGLIAATYWLVKSTIQIPIANYLDKTEGEKDEFYALVLSLLLGAAAAFTFSISTKLWHVFLVQAVYAVAMALYVPSWYGIFSRHLDQKRFSFDWTLDSTVVGLAAFVASMLSGVLANFFGFPFVFLLVGFLSIIGAMIIFLVPNLIIPGRAKEKILLRDPSIPSINR